MNLLRGSFKKSNCEDRSASAFYGQYSIFDYSSRYIARMDVEILMSRLTEEESDILTLSLKGFASEEIAQKYDTTPVAIRIRLYRIRRKIQRETKVKMKNLAT